MGKEFDYYIFIDYSENLIGYSIIEGIKLKELLPKISRFKHCRKARNKKLYLKNIKNTLKREDVKSSFLRIKIKELNKNMEIYLDVLELFKKMISIIDGENIVIKQESELKERTSEYQTSLVLDNLLNIERLIKND